MKPFFLPGGETGCLLIHGFTGTPAEMRQMGDYLHARGCTVMGVRLAGHGTRPSDLRGKTWRDWVGSAAAGLADLRAKCSRVYTVGLSMGGTISLYLAAFDRVDGAIAICAPVYLDLKLYLARPLKYLFNFKNEVTRNIKDPAARSGHLAYTGAPPGAVIQLLALLRSARSGLGRITAPVLLFQAEDDCIVPRENAPFIYQRVVKSTKKELIWLKNSGHMATIDHDKAVVFSETLRFIRENC
ncbi:MAG: alpha/beta fold hydrolase [Peptococcaceae bacterium]|nr:alpha/beta fold hydrolase [Peptococcaceae bacterium]